MTMDIFSFEFGALFVGAVIVSVSLLFVFICTTYIFINLL